MQMNALSIFTNLLYPIVKLLGQLAENAIYGGVHYRDNTEYSMYLYAKGTCPRAHEVSKHLITLPLHMWLTDEEVNRIIAVVNDYVK